VIADLAPRAGILGTLVPKGFRAGTDRTVDPETTLARARALMPATGITRLADITGLDRLGIPVFVAVRPNARSLAVSQGKGLTPAAASASALMEAIELHHAERIEAPLLFLDPDEMARSGRAFCADGVARETARAARRRMLWIAGTDLIANEPVWVPYDAVHMDLTVPPVMTSRYVVSSNGLSSGNHALEATAHAVFELIERDATALWDAGTHEERVATRVDTATVGDEACRSVLARMDEAGLNCATWETTSDLGIACFYCVLSDEAEDVSGNGVTAFGMGCHVDAAIALLRALTEAAQTRLTVIAGSRDDVSRAQYVRASSPQSLETVRRLIGAPGDRRAFADVPSRRLPSFNDDVVFALERLAAAGLRRVVIVDLTRGDLGVPVVKAVVPGLEHPHAYREPDGRAARRARGRTPA
jgi:YcaO-like protein with predicted kinase domain